MKTSFKIKFSIAVCLLALAALSMPQQSSAQRFSHAGGGGMNRSAPASRPAPTVSRPAPVVNRPAPVMNRPAEQPTVNRTINGGSRNNGNHDLSRNNAANVAPRTNNAPANVHENANVRRNVNVHENVNVYHSRNQPYHPYAYHPYHPYYWGSRWHPIGFFLSSLATDAYLFSLANQQYYYDEGVYYEPTSGGYTVVPAPIGATVNFLPIGYETVPVGDDTYYYYGGTFYISTGDNAFQVVAAPFGAVVSQLPDGAVEQDINGQTYLVYNNAYYQPVSINGQDAYQVVQVN
jgi:hypothetical protein